MFGKAVLFLRFIFRQKLIVMSNRNPKLFLLFGFYTIAHFAAACWPNSSICDCPTVLPFFDYSALRITSKEQTVVQRLELEVRADSVQYLAQVNPVPGWGFITSAWGCDCNYNGEQGPKHRVQKFNIYADRVFNDTLPAGVSLNSLFFVDGGDVLYSMLPDEPLDYFWSFGEGPESIRPLTLLSYEKPKQLGVPFRFRVEMVKSNGDILQVETGEIIYQ